MFQIYSKMTLPFIPDWKSCRFCYWWSSRYHRRGNRIKHRSWECGRSHWRWLQQWWISQHHWRNWWGRWRHHWKCSTIHWYWSRFCSRGLGIRLLKTFFLAFKIIINILMIHINGNVQYYYSIFLATLGNWPILVKTITMVVSEVAVIEKLPIEVLEIILNQLSLKDIGNCSQTCIWFKDIIEVIYKNKSKENFYWLGKEKSRKNEKVLFLLLWCKNCNWRNSKKSFRQWCYPCEIS